ncbi:hypothetical protein HanIR_Chr11g0527571 [Helianthus annuus]|nr:hypothetical protein HanIR_Chr11g0527571 [Helianthus annuus]
MNNNSKRLDVNDGVSKHYPIYDQTETIKRDILTYMIITLFCLICSITHTYLL